MKSPDLILPSPIQQLKDPLFEQANISVFLKRDDLIHPEISGNKWRKLKYNIAEAIRTGAHTLVSFGGAYSNHLFALASFGKLAGLKTIGIVRGDELNPSSSPTLRHCADQGMELHFISRENYRQKEQGAYFSDFLRDPGNFVIPEGGTNEFALPGVGEIVDECRDQGIHADFFAVPAGTGGTAAGLLARGQRVIAFPVLKGAGFLRDDIARWENTSEGILDLQMDYHFGGYGKYTTPLLEFIERFENTHGIAIEQVYTGKMLFGLFDLIKRGYFAKETTVVALHTGGLQGKLKF